MTEQPYVDMILVPRSDVNKIRRALLWVCANAKHKGFSAKAEKMFHAAHERLSELLKAEPHTVDITQGSLSNTDTTTNNKTADTDASGESANELA